MNKPTAKPKRSEAYRRGYDAGKYGATLYNSHFSIFATPLAKQDWEEGNKDGRAAAARMESSEGEK